MIDREFESRVLRFERARQLGGPVEITHHLRGLTGPDRSRLLVEILCVDLEYGWRESRAVEPTPLAGYIAQFPELISLDRLPIELIGEEYRARSRWGDRPSHEAFLSPFRERHGPIRAELLRVDAEIGSESAEPRRSPGLAAPEADDLGPGPAVPLLSDRDFLLRRLIGAGRMGKVYECDPTTGAGKWP